MTDPKIEYERRITWGDKSIVVRAKTPEVADEVAEQAARNVGYSNWAKFVTLATSDIGAWFCVGVLVGALLMGAMQ